MHEHEWLAERFEENRGHLRAVAYRMLGSLSEADDAVQESWLHLSRSDTSGVKNLGGWLTTVVARVCLDMLRSRTSRREELRWQIDLRICSRWIGGKQDEAASCPGHRQEFWSRSENSASPHREEAARAMWCA